MKTVQFFVQGLPKGQPRPKARAVKAGKRLFAQFYNPKTADGWKKQIAAEAERNFDGAFAYPVHLLVDFFMPRPQHHFKRGELRQDAPKYHTCVPDADNLAKAVMDALTDFGMWTDDKLVVGLHVMKRYGSTVGAMIEIQEVEPTPPPV
jgi:Holliday junction resolvase RusA-like endonuclease